MRLEPGSLVPRALVAMAVVGQVGVAGAAPPRDVPSIPDATAVVWMPGAERLVTGRGKRVEVWRRLGRRPERTLGAHPDDVNALWLDPRGRYLASMSGSRGTEDATPTLILWDLRTGRRLRQLSGAAVVDRSVGKVAAIDGQGRVNVWSVRTGRLLRRFAGASTYRPRLAFGPRGRYLAATGEGYVRVWDVATGRLRRVVVTARDTPRPVSVDPRGRYLLTRRIGEVQLWDLRTGLLVRRQRMGTEDLIVGPRWRYVIANDGVGWALHLWDIRRGTRIWEVERQLILAAGPRRRYLLTYGRGYDVKIWRPYRRRPRLVGTFRHSGQAALGAIDARGRYVASGSAGLRVWDVRRARRLR